MVTWAWLVAILLVALGLRVGLALALCNIGHPDEIFQTLEPAHRIWFGWGIVTWEWREGIRSWLFPGLLAGLMGATEGLAEGPRGYLAGVAILLSILSLSVVVAGFLFGRRLFGISGAVITAGLGVVWYDLVYVAPKALNEALAAYIFVVAVYLTYATNERQSFTRYLTIGALLGLASCFRFQVAPAILFIMVYACRGDIRGRWLPMIVGGTLPVLALGALDMLTWGLPFQSIWKNLWLNIVEGRSQDYGVSPFYWYFGRLTVVWRAAVVPMAVLFVIGARRALPLAGATIVHMLAHMLISHKELRFLFPVMPLVIILIGLGSAELVTRLVSSGISSWRLGAIISGTLLGWTVASTAIAIGEGFRANWSRSSGMILATQYAGSMPDLCGIGLVKLFWSRTGGYTYLHRPVPIYWLLDATQVADVAASLNYLMIPRPLVPEVKGFEEIRCWESSPNEYGQPIQPAVCLLKRPGSCDGGMRYEINSVLTKHGI